MRTKTIELRIYRFDELSEDAKQVAKDRYAEIFGFDFANDYLNSLIALAERFDGKLKYWAIDWFGTTHSVATFEMPEMERDEIAARLSQLGTFNPETGKGNGDCELTGFCGDEDAIDGFRAAFNAGETDLAQLMERAFRSLLVAAHDDCEGRFSDEDFGETCDANDWEYLESGELYSERSAAE